MSRLLVVGSVAYDTVETPSGKEEDILGGSAVYFSLAARIFSTVALSSAVGDDFAEEDRGLLKSVGVDVDCLEVVKDAKTFRWHGRYHENMNQRDTISVDLNVFEDFQPVLPDRYRKCPFVFLANGSTATQLSLLEQVEPYKPVVFFDTMDLWIETEREGVLELLERTRGVVLNDSEALLLSGEPNVVKAGHKLRSIAASDVVIKKGEHGVTAFLEKGRVVSLPAFPLAEVVDPTGAGDTFAGGFIGHLAEQGGADLVGAVVTGTAAASFTVEGFGLEGLVRATRSDLEKRRQAITQRMDESFRAWCHKV